MSILASTSIQPFGIIPFGSSDPSVLMQNTLMSEAAITGESDATGTLIGSGHTFTDGLGIICPVGSGIKFADPTNYASLEIAGQISFEIETEFLAEYTPTNVVAGTSGFDHTSNDYPLSWAAADSSATYGRFYMSAASEVPTFQFSAASAQGNTALVTNLGASRFARVTLSWIGNTISFYVNGAMLLTSDAVTASDLFKNIYVGSFRGLVTEAAGGNLSHYMRNLIVSNRPVMLPSHPSLAIVPFAGDSFAAQAFQLSGVAGGGYNHNAKYTIEGYFADRGLKITLADRGYSGAAVESAHAVTYSDQTEYTELLADNCPIAILQIGTNDALWSSFDSATFETEYHNLIDAIMATKDYLVVGNIPTVKTATGADTAEYAARTAAVNNVINGLESWWDTNNPSRAGAIRVYDLFSATGGESPDSDMFNGSWTGDNDDVHLSSRGRKIEGQLIAENVYYFLNGN